MTTNTMAINTTATRTRTRTLGTVRTLLAAAAGLAVGLSATAISAQQDRTTKRSTSISITSDGGEVRRDVVQIVDGVEYRLTMADDEILSVTVDGLELDEDAYRRTPDAVVIQDGDRTVTLDTGGSFVGVLNDRNRLGFFDPGGEGGARGLPGLRGLAQVNPGAQAVWQVATPPKTMVGISQTSVGDQLRQHLDLEEGVGVVVIHVVDELPAARAGMREGDVIIEIAGDPVRSSAQLTEALREREPGDVLGVVALRKGVPQSFELELVEYDRDRLNRFDEFFAQNFDNAADFPGIIRLEGRPLDPDRLQLNLDREMQAADEQLARAQQQLRGLNEMLIRRGDRAIVIEREADELRERAEMAVESALRQHDQLTARLWDLVEQLEKADTDEARAALREQLSAVRELADASGRSAQRYAQILTENVDPEIENHTRWVQRQAREAQEGLAARNDELEERLGTLEERLDRVLRALEAQVAGDDERE